MTIQIAHEKKPTRSFYLIRASEIEITFHLSGAARIDGNKINKNMSCLENHDFICPFCIVLSAIMAGILH